MEITDLDKLKPGEPMGENNNQPFGINSFTPGNTGIISGCALHGTTSAIQNNGSTMTVGTNYTV